MNLKQFYVAKIFVATFLEGLQTCFKNCKNMAMENSIIWVDILSHAVLVGGVDHVLG